MFWDAKVFSSLKGLLWFEHCTATVSGSREEASEGRGDSEGCHCRTTRASEKCWERTPRRSFRCLPDPPTPAFLGEAFLLTVGVFLLTILFKFITRMKLLFSNYLGGYSYGLQGSSELQSGSKTCHSTKKFSGINFPKYVISISTRKFPGINFFFSRGRCQLDDFRGTPLEFCFGRPSLSARCGTNVLCPQSEISLGNVALRDFWRRGLETERVPKS